MESISELREQMAAIHSLADTRGFYYYDEERIALYILRQDIHELELQNELEKKSIAQKRDRGLKKPIDGTNNDLSS